MPVISLKGCFMLILFLYFNIVKSYKEIKAGELIYFSNLFLYFCNKWQ